MKKGYKYLSNALLMVALLISFTKCAGTSKTDAATAFGKIEGTYNFVAAKVEGATAPIENATFTFNGGKLTVTDTKDTTKIGTTVINTAESFTDYNGSLTIGDNNDTKYVAGLFTYADESTEPFKGKFVAVAMTQEDYNNLKAETPTQPATLKLVVLTENNKISGITSEAWMNGAKAAIGDGGSGSADSNAFKTLVDTYGETAVVYAKGTAKLEIKKESIKSGTTDIYKSDSTVTESAVGTYQQYEVKTGDNKYYFYLKSLEANEDFKKYLTYYYAGNTAKTTDAEIEAEAYNVELTEGDKISSKTPGGAFTTALTDVNYANTNDLGGFKLTFNSTGATPPASMAVLAADKGDMKSPPAVTAAALDVTAANYKTIVISDTIAFLCLANTAATGTKILWVYGTKADLEKVYSPTAVADFPAKLQTFAGNLAVTEYKNDVTTLKALKKYDITKATS